MSSIASHASIRSRASNQTEKVRPGKPLLPLDKLDALDACENLQVQMAALRNMQFVVKREDRSGLVRMKWNGIDFDKNTGYGVADLNYWMASRRYEKYGDAPPVLAHCKLVERGEDGQWSATNADGARADLADGDYIFVTMADGTIRIGDPVNGQNAHCTLSNHAAYVKYAGTIRFHEGKPVEGSSQSGTYLPDPKEWSNSGFESDILSNPAGLDFETIKKLYDEGRTATTPPSSEANLAKS